MHTCTFVKAPGIDIQYWALGVGSLDSEGWCNDVFLSESTIGIVSIVCRHCLPQVDAAC